MDDGVRRVLPVAAIPPALGEPPRRGFVGRAEELETLRAAVDTVITQGRARIVLIAAEPGNGKTALAAAAARDAAARGCRVLYGRGQEGVETPFGAWRQALKDAWPAGERDRADLFDAIVEHLDTQTASAATVVVLDDMQWGDHGTALLAAHLTATLADRPLCLVVCYRSTEVAASSPLASLLANVVGEPTATCIELGGLAEADVRALLSIVDGSEAQTDESVVRSICERSRGNAFFVSVLLDEVATGRRSSTLGEVIRHRVARLGEGAVSLLRVAAIIGETFDADVIANVTGAAFSGVLEVLEAAQRDGLLYERPGEGFSFVHGLVAEALSAEVSHARQQQIHRAVADALRERGSDATAIAAHLTAADPRDRSGREATIDAALVASSEAVASLAYEDAVRRLSASVDLIHRWGLDDDRRCSALLALMDAQTRAGEADDAVATAASALPLAVRLERWADVETLLLRFPRVASAAPDPLLLRALDEAGRRAPPNTPIRALALATEAWILHYSEDLDEIRARARAAVELADRHGGTVARAHTRNMLLIALGGDPDLREQSGLLDTVEALATASDGAVLSAYEIALRRVYLLLRMGDLDGVGVEVTRLETRPPRSGRSRTKWFTLNLKAMLAITNGRFDEGEKFSAAAEVIAPHGERANASARLAHVVTTAYLRGRMRDFAEVLSAFAQGFPVPAIKACVANALVDAGRDTEARALVAQLAANDVAAVPRDDAWTTAVFMLADVCHRLGLTTEAEVLYRAGVPHAGEFVVTSAAAAVCFGPIDRSLGQLAATCGWDDLAEAHLERAVELCAQTGARPFLALARADQALLGVAGAAQEARAIAADLGLDLVLQRLQRLDEGVPRSTFVQEGDVWRTSFAGRTARVKDLLGLHYLRHLLARPGEEVPAVALQGGVSETGIPVLDERAKAEYRRRLEQIDDDLAEAERFGDRERLARALVEREAIGQELSRALGLSGRSREAGSSGERARLNVTRAIRAAIDRIASVHPELGEHLRGTVRTGSFCEYAPAESMRWTLD